MKSISKLSASLTLALTLVGLILFQTTPVAVAAVAGPSQTTVEAANLPGAGILVGIVCLIFAAIAVFPMLIERRPTR
jgi:hypothetical protein